MLDILTTQYISKKVAIENKSELEGIRGQL